MPRLSKIPLAQINEVLNKSFFTSAGYEVETYDDVDKIVKITFTENKKHSISLSYRTKSRGFLGVAELDEEPVRLLIVTESPGEFTETQSHQVGTIAGFLESLQKWTSRVKSEILLVDAFQKTIDALKEDLNKQIDEHVKDADAHFTDGEKKDLFEKLRKFEERFAELAKDDPAAKKQSDEVKAIVEDFARAANVLPKRIWYRTFYYKLLYVSQRVLAYPPVQALLKLEAQHLLGDTPKDI